MGRAQRIDISGGVYHVMNRGVDKHRIFFGDVDRVEFGRRLADIHERFEVRTLAYCLMDNHYHLLVQTSETPLSVAMHHLAGVYVRHTNDRIGRDGPLFRSRFHAVQVADDPYLMWAARYIHRNALDVAGVERSEQYRWSSLRAYLGYRATPSFLDTNVVLSCFDLDRRRFLAFHDDRSEPYVPFADATAFERFVTHAIALDDLAGGADLDTMQWLSRTVQLVALERVGDPELVSALLPPFPSNGARRMAFMRARRRAEDEPIVRRIVDEVTPHLAASRAASRSVPGTLRAG